MPRAPSSRALACAALSMALPTLLALGCTALAGFGDLPLPEMGNDGGDAPGPDDGAAGEEEAATQDRGPDGEEAAALLDEGAGEGDELPAAEGSDVATGDSLTSMDSSPDESAIDSPADGTTDAVASVNPGRLTGLVLWLDAAKGLDNSDADLRVLAWRDQSGQGNDATSAGSPTLRPGAIGGLPAVHFNGSTDYFVINDSASLQFSSLDFLIAVVVKHTTPIDAGWGYGILYSKQERDVSPYIGVDLDGNTGASAGFLAQVAFRAESTVETAEADFNDGRPRCVIMHRVAVAPGTLAAQADAGPIATLEMRINGVPVASNTGPGYAGDVSAVGYTATVGGTAVQQDLMGDIAEVIAVKGALSDGDIHGLEAYLVAKYGL